MAVQPSPHGVLLAYFIWLLCSAAALQTPPAGEQQELFHRNATSPISRVLASLNRPPWPPANQGVPSSPGGHSQQTDSKTIGQQTASPQQNKLFQSFVNFEPSNDVLSSLNVPPKPGSTSDSQQRQPSLTGDELVQSNVPTQPEQGEGTSRGAVQHLGSFSSFVSTPAASHPVYPPGAVDLNASPYWSDPDGRPAPDPPLVRMEDLVNTRPSCGNGTVAACDPHERYRRLDGSCNNLDKPLYGSANSVLQRLVHKQEDATMMRRVAKSGRLLPNPRSVGEAIRGARSLHTQRDTNLLLMVLGQFIDHDLVLVPVVEDLTYRGKDLPCRVCTSWLQHPACAPVPVGLGDPVFQGAARPFCLPFTRSVGQAALGPDGRQYLENTNVNTGYLDLSAVYGSDTCTGRRLRSYTAGQLLTAHTRDSPYGLPVLAPREVLPAQCRTKSQQCHYAGDERPNENLALLTMHTAFMREHNHLAKELGRLNPSWGDERLYQEARRFNVAQYQHIAVTELLPRLFGPRSALLQKYGFTPRPGPQQQQVYQPQVNGQVLQEFTTAAYRFGHTLVPNYLVLSDERLLPMGSLKMAKVFNDPSVMQDTMKGTMHDALVRGLLCTRVEGADLKVVDTLRDKLFVEGEDPTTGQDLIARNLARGRDHGLAPYTSYRSPCSLPPVGSWQQMSPLIPPEHVTRLQTVYEHWDDVDLFVGGLAEDVVDGGLLGPTFACIIALQFYLAKVGDRFWYDGGARGLSPPELTSLRDSAVLSKLVARTLDNGASLVPPDALRLPNIRSNRPVSAHSLRGMSMLPWRDPQALQPRLCLYHEKSYGMNEPVPVSPCLACRCSGDRYVHCDMLQLDCGVMDRYIPEGRYDEYCYRMCPQLELGGRPRPYPSQNIPQSFLPYP